jgi:hypothetical protein
MVKTATSKLMLNEKEICFQWVTSLWKRLKFSFVQIALLARESPSTQQLNHTRTKKKHFCHFLSSNNFWPEANFAIDQSSLSNFEKKFGRRCICCITAYLSVGPRATCDGEFLNHGNSDLISRELSRHRALSRRPLRPFTLRRSPPTIPQQSQIPGAFSARGIVLHPAWQDFHNSDSKSKAMSTPRSRSCMHAYGWPCHAPTSWVCRESPLWSPFLENKIVTCESWPQCYWRIG